MDRALVFWEDDTYFIISLKTVERPRKEVSDYTVGEDIYSKIPGFPGKYHGKIVALSDDNKYLRELMREKQTEEPEKETASPVSAPQESVVVEAEVHEPPAPPAKKRTREEKQSNKENKRKKNEQVQVEKANKEKKRMEAEKKKAEGIRRNSSFLQSLESFREQNSNLTSNPSTPQGQRHVIHMPTLPFQTPDYSPIIDLGQMHYTPRLPRNRHHGSAPHDTTPFSSVLNGVRDCFNATCASIREDLQTARNNLLIVQDEHKRVLTELQKAREELKKFQNAQQDPAAYEYRIQADGRPRAGLVSPIFARDHHMVELMPGTGVYVYPVHIKTTQKKTKGTQVVRYLMSVFYTNPELINLGNLTGSNGKEGMNKTIVAAILVECESEDFLCQILAYTAPPPMDLSWISVPEPAACDLEGASFCISGYLLRLMSSSFLNVDEFNSICWEQLSLASCVATKTQACSTGRREFFAGTVEWFHNLTSTGCEMVVDNRLPNCSIAKECLYDMIGYSVSPEGYSNGNHMCWKLEKTQDCIFQHGPACSAAEMPFVREGIQLVGNLTKMNCPYHSETLCKLSMMTAINPGATCAENNLRECVFTYYYATMNKQLTNDEYCKFEQAAESCVMTNSTNCAPYTLLDIQQAMRPGVVASGYMCPRDIVNYDAICPVYYNCSVKDSAEKINSMLDKTIQGKLAGKSNAELCSAITTDMAALRSATTHCNPLEMAMMNQVIANIDLALTFVYGVDCSSLAALTSSMQPVDPVFGELTNCFQTLYTSLHQSSLNATYGFYDVCQTAMAFNSCASMIGMPADRPAEMLIQHIMNNNIKHIQSFINTTCEPIKITDQTVKLVKTPVPATCQQDTVFHCMAYFATKVAFMPMLGESDQLALCGEAAYIREMCVMNENLTVGCPEVSVMQMRTFQYVFEQLVMASPACSWMVTEDTKRGSARLMAFGEMMNEDGDIEVLQDQIGKWQEAVLSTVKNMQMAGGMRNEEMEEDHKEDDMDEKDGEKDNMDEEMCRPRQATECYLTAISTVKTEDWYGPAYEDLCGKLDTMYGCAKKELVGCMEWQQILVHKQYDAVAIFYHKVCDNMDYMSEEDKQTSAQSMLRWLDTTSEMRMRGGEQRMSEVLEEFMKMSEGKEMEWDEEELNKMAGMDVMEEGVDVNCVDKSMYRAHARCDAEKAVGLLAGMNKALLNPQVSHAGLCLKYGLSVRGYLLTTEGCDWAQSMVFHMLANHTMRKMGDKCDVHIEEHCRDKRSCDPKGITRCYHSIQLHVAAIIEDKLPANVQVCEQLAHAAKCVEELHCDERTVYSMHETMEPALSTLTKMCYRMPVQTCTTSSMWKMAAIVLLNKKIYETSHALNYMKMHMMDDDGMNTMRNNTNYTNTTMPEDMVNPGRWSEEGMARALMTLQHILKRDSGCSKDPEVDGDLATGLKYLVRYAFMYEKMVDTDENFMNMMTLAMAGELRNAVGDAVGRDSGSNNQELGDLIEMVRERFNGEENMSRNNMTMQNNTTTMPGNSSMGMDWKLRDVIGRIIVHLIVYGNSDTFMQVETHKVVKAKMMKAIELAKMRGNDLELEDDDQDAFERLDLNLGRDLKNSVDWEMMNIFKTLDIVARLERSNMSMEHTVELLEMAQHIHDYRKSELCMSMVGAWQCTSSTLMLLPESVRGMVNQTLNSLYSVTGYFCGELKCYSCDEFQDNEQCNKQAMVTCDSGQVCFTHVNNGEMKKGCAAPSMGDWQKDGEIYSTCVGYGCNEPKFGARKEMENEMCQPFMAVGCMYELLPTMLQGQEVDHREVYKAFYCMEHYTSSCILEEHREISRMAQRVKVAMIDVQCSQPNFVHTCGISSILELADLVKTPGASRKTICHTLNGTVSNLMLADYWNQCTEYEMVMAYNELNMISTVIGPDFCPGLDPRDPKRCAEERAKLPPMCDMEQALGVCLYEADVLKKMVEMVGEIEEWRDMDFLCSRLEHMLKCVGNHTTSCDDTQMQDVHRMIGERLGQAIPLCPSISIELAMCDTTPLSEYNCMMYEGIDTCLQPTEVYKNPYVLCSMNETMLNDTVTCLHTHIKHCTAVQALPVSYIIQTYMAQSMILCGNHSMAKEIAQGIVNSEQGVAMETMMNMMMGKASGMMLDNEDSPITNLVNVILSLRTKITMTGNVTDALMALMSEMGKDEDMEAPSGKMNLMPMMKASMEMSKLVSGLHTKRIYHTDVTHDVARCVSQYSMAVQRLLLYPEVSHEMACEGKAVFRKCLKKLELTPVAKMFVMALENKVAMESERDCYYYLDDVMVLGKDIADVTTSMRMLINATGAFKNATAAVIALRRNSTIFQHANLTKEEGELITAIIGMMSNMDGIEDTPKEVVMTLIKGMVSQFKEIVTVTSDCNAWMISHQITFVYMQVLTGAFYPYSQYPAMCSNLKTMYETLAPEVMKCPADYQAMYHKAMTFLHSETSEVCNQPFMDSTPPTTCNANLVTHCLMDLMPLLSTAGTERKRLCQAVEEASLCMSYGLRNCNDTQSLGPYLQFEHIKSTVADSCPYLTASMQCFDNTDILTGQIQLCDVTMASEYCASLVTGSTDLEKCTKLPDMMNCMYRYTSSCSAIEMHVAYTHLHIVLEDVVNMCNSDSMIRMYRQAAASNTCSQAEQCTITQVYSQCGAFIPATFGSCSEFSDFTNCLTGLVKGCNTMQLAMAQTGLSSLLSDAQLACIDIVSVTSLIQYEKEAARSVINCVNTYKLEVASALTNTDNAHMAICTAFANLVQCFAGDMSEEAQATVFTFYGTSSNVTWELVREYCWSDDQAANMARSQMGAMYNYGQERKMNNMQKDGPACDINTAAKILSSYSVVSMFSSLLSAEDKKDFCDPNGQTSIWVQTVHASAENCSEATQGPLLGLGAALHASSHFSGICAEELMTCDPTSALDCGIEAGREVMANSSLDNLNETICRIYDHSMECAKRYTYACPQEVNWKILDKMETSLCLSYSMIKHCPSVRRKMARDDTDIPSCDADSWMRDMMEYMPEDMDVKEVTRTENGTATTSAGANDTTKMMDDYKVCNLSAAYGCLSDLGMEMMSPMMQCNSMHSEYTKTMLCVDKMTSSCDSSTMSIVEVVVRIAVKTMYKMCPQVVMMPCHESKHCRLDEAQHCVDVLTYMSNMPNMTDQHVCLAREMAEICVKEKLQHCSVFGKTTMMEAIRHATPNRHLVCDGDLGVCIQKFFFNTIGVITGDVMMAQATRMRNKIASEVTSHFMENPHMVGVSGINKRIEMNLANMSREMREMMSGGANMSMMPRDMQMTNTGDAMLMDGVTYMWGMISGGMDEDYHTNHAKAKVIQCAAISEAFTCMNDQMHMESWSYLSSAQGTFVSQNLLQLSEIVSGMCHEDTTCVFLNEPESCQVLPAMWMTMAGLGQVLQTNNAEFCSYLPSLMSNVTALTSSCSDDVGRHFKAMLGFQEEAKEAICKLPSNCNIDGAVACLTSLNKDNFCSENENVKTCMNGALKSCAVMVQANLTGELQKLENAYGQSCVKMPYIEIPDPARLIRLEEGTMSSTNILVTMMEPPSCGDNCYVRVSVALSEDAGSATKCSVGTDSIPQVMVVRNGDSSEVCNMVFTDADYSSPRVVPLISTADLIQDGTHYVTATLTATKIANGVVLKETQLAEYQIVVADRDSYSVCLVSDDSVMSFDGLSHNNYYQGLFLIYKHDSLPQEVFVLKQRSLNSFGTQTCAVAVKSEDDVLIIDRCRESNGNIRNTQQLYVTGTLHPFTEVYVEGRTYWVRFPSGTTVSIEDLITSVQIMVHASPLDMGHSLGICGVYDDMTDNDLTLPNGEAIAIQAASTSVRFAISRNFDRQWLASSSDLFLESSNFPASSFCSCAGSTNPGPCIYRNSLVDTCAAPLPGTDITPALKAGAAIVVTGCDRKRRQAGNGLFDNVEIDPTYDDTVTEPTWDPPRNFTLESATAYCQQQVNSKAVVVYCEQLSTLTITTETVIQECVNKIQSTDSTDGASFMLDLYIGQCESEARLLLSSTDTTVLQLAGNILSNLCPNDCSGHGSCFADKCLCFQNWLGDDCSIDERLPPLVTSVENNGLCPLGSTDCAVITILGNNFSNDKTPSCHFQSLTVDQNGAIPTGTVQTVAAEYVSMTQVNCPVPATMMLSSLKWGVQLAVSNDGTTMGAYYKVVSFDSACYSCSTTAGCTTTTTGCVIENVCYEAFSNKPGDVCHYCDPSLTNMGWTMKIAPPVCDLPATVAPPTTQSPTVVTGTTTTPTTTTSSTTTTPTTPTPTTAAPVMKTTTEGPVLNQDAQLIVVVLGVVAGLFAVLSCILAVKYCQRQPDSQKDNYRNDSSSGPGSIEDRTREFDNLAYDNFSKKPGAIGGVSTFSPPPHEAAQPYPSQNVVDMSSMDSDPATKL